MPFKKAFKRVFKCRGERTLFAKWLVVSGQDWTSVSASKGGSRTRTALLRTRTIWSEYEEGEGEARVPEMTLNPTLKRHTYSTCLRVYLSEYA